MKTLTFTVIESPYAGDIERNTAYVRAAMADCFKRGEIPFASHALYTQLGVLNDGDPDQRALGIGAGFTMRNALKDASRSGAYRVITAVYSDLGMSTGMKQGIESSSGLGVPIEFRSLEGWKS